VAIPPIATRRSVVAVGTDAKRMRVATGNIQQSGRMKDGVIRDFSVCEKMLQRTYQQVHENSLSQASPTCAYCVPCQIHSGRTSRYSRVSPWGAGAREDSD